LHTIPTRGYYRVVVVIKFPVGAGTTYAEAFVGIYLVIVEHVVE
jgi:hypothetical protein